MAFSRVIGDSGRSRERPAFDLELAAQEFDVLSHTLTLTNTRSKQKGESRRFETDQASSSAAFDIRKDKQLH